MLLVLKQPPVVTPSKEGIRKIPLKIWFPHLPIIAAALGKYEGAMVLVSHVPEFIAQIRIDEVLDLEK